MNLWNSTEKRLESTSKYLSTYTKSTPAARSSQIQITNLYDKIEGHAETS